ncbi:hypothetical protein, partial [Mycobacterium kyorinense]|uniref:hypothetical protein n=1 Tax=Mycobacterium kyorinense TaxID=487514 RepID=UPI001B80E7B3
AVKAWQKTTTNKTTKHTIEFSNNTHPSGRATSPRRLPRSDRADRWNILECRGIPQGCRRVADPPQRDVNKLREGKLRVK